MKVGDSVQALCSMLNVQEGEIYEIKSIMRCLRAVMVRVQEDIVYYPISNFIPVPAALPSPKFPYILRDLLELGNSLEPRVGKRARFALQEASRRTPKSKQNVMYLNRYFREEERIMNCYGVALKVGVEK